MNKTKTPLAAIAILGIAFAGNSLAQTPTPSPTPVPTLSSSAAPLLATHDWTDLLALASPLVTGTYAYAPGQLGLTESQVLNNTAIDLVSQATGPLSGWQAGHDYCISKGYFIKAASFSVSWLHNPVQAVSEAALALAAASPAPVEWQASNLVFQMKAGAITDAQLTSWLQSQSSYISKNAAQSLYNAYNKSADTVPNDIAFFTALLKVTENNPTNAVLVGQITDQISRLKHILATPTPSPAP
jgi:hypothetical protein